MYFPYLYGRAYDLLALRSILKDHRALGGLIPIVEPVNSNSSAIERCLADYSEADQRICVLVNPDKHELKNPIAAKAWQKNFVDFIDDKNSVIPLLRCDAAITQASIDSFLKKFSDREVAFLYQGCGLDDAGVKKLAAIKTVVFHIGVDAKISASHRALLPKDKYVDIKDCFTKLVRNADYNGAEFYTDRHKTFAASGCGFGDYATIGSVFQAGGSTPYAVAIHAAYKDPKTGDIWVEHFVSDDKEKDDSDVATKFLQAAKKLTAAATKRKKEFGQNYSIDAYVAYVAGSYFPGLPKNKQHQIEHHLCLMLDVLSGDV
ncbi:sce7725 family protein [Lysobacter antibioticus]|uniref:sce7725 family protein n=1 Tax=Lysobacter antibioticus TaxID=84531 RepID=UPI00094E9515|nr:sce7725 family protein [Lysobacter antibioticus]